MSHYKVILRDPKAAGKLLPPWIHRVISNAKAVIRGPHRGISENHLQAYLSEICYRFNRRFWEKELFDRQSILVPLRNVRRLLAKIYTVSEFTGKHKYHKANVDLRRSDGWIWPTPVDSLQRSILALVLGDQMAGADPKETIGTVFNEWPIPDHEPVVQIGRVGSSTRAYPPRKSPLPISSPLCLSRL